MKTVKLAVIAVLAIVGLVSVSCSQDNDEIKAPQEETEQFQMPEVINIVSEEQPDGVVTRATYSNITAEMVKGTYEGHLSNIWMGGKKKDNEKNKNKVVYTDITKKGEQQIGFSIRPFSVGRMPGTLSVNIENLDLGTDGNFYATNLPEKVQLKLFNVWKLKKYDVTLLDGSFTPEGNGYRLKFTMKSEGTIWNISIFKASVDFDGKK